MNELISIIVPVYNISEDLPNCLDSILAQTYPNIEIVAVDDGSSDGSGDILDRYADKNPNIRVIHKENGGVTSARLCGINAAEGQWIGFVDGDDEIEADMYERLLDNAKKYGAQISHCGYQLCLPDGRVNYFHNTGLLAKQDKITALKELLSGERIEPGLWNKLFHKTLFHSLLHGAIDPSIKINEDLLMNFHLFSAADTSVFDDWCPYHYLARDGSATRSRFNEHKVFDPIKVRDIIRNTVCDELRDEAERIYIRTCINSYHELVISGANGKSHIGKVLELLKNEKADFSLLGGKSAIIARAIVSVPSLYQFIYRTYCRFLKKDRYC